MRRRTTTRRRKMRPRRREPRAEPGRRNLRQSLRGGLRRGRRAPRREAAWAGARARRVDMSALACVGLHGLCGGGWARRAPPPHSE
eukprot:5534196-Prymnesium_polylepis.1